MRVQPVLLGYHDELVLEGEWEICTTTPAPGDLLAVTNQPVSAFFTEAGFREASTLLGAGPQLVRGRRLSPEESLASLNVSSELTVDLLLHEPQVAQPTHFSFDARGRLWVAQYRQYPYPAGLKMLSRDKYYRATFDRIPAAPPHHDRGHDIISVHEDTDGDGILDLHREVITGLNMANAVLHGHGGIWVLQTPYLLFYPDADGDDIPDRDPEVRLSGFGLEDTHSIANGLAWGPDGWIYGVQGSTTTSHIRRPGTDPTNAPGVYFESCMVWRYHPDTRDYEIFAEGGGNNFGLEFDAEGRLFTGHNGGETRGWHFVQNGIYLKQGKDPGKFGPPTNPFDFGEMPMMRTTDRIIRFSHHFAFAEGSALPASLQGRLFSADPLHHEIVVSTRTRDGATFRTADTEIGLKSTDPSFRPVFVANAPDGALYVADFYEEYIAHGQNYQGQIDPDSGRIYRLRGRTSRLNREVNLANLTTSELVATLSHPNKWHRQTAVRLLAERRDPTARKPLVSLLTQKNPEATNTVESGHPALEALWTLHQAGWLDEATEVAALQHPSGSVRAWVIRLAGDHRQLPDDFSDRVARLIPAEPDSEVRCQIASTVRRLPAHQALPLIAALLIRDADSTDPFIPLMCWFGLERLCDTDRAAVLALFDAAAGGTGAERAAGLWNSTLVNQHILPRLLRRFATRASRADLLVCAQLLTAAPGAPQRQRLLHGFTEAMEGRILPPLPDELTLALEKAGFDSVAFRVRRGDSTAIDQALALAADSTLPASDRLLLIRVLGEVHPASASPVLLSIATHDTSLDIRRAALIALSSYDSPDIGTALVGSYPTLPDGLQRVAQNLLTSRTAWSLPFLQLIEKGTVKSSSVAEEITVRLRNSTDPAVKELGQKLFPEHAAPNSTGSPISVEKLRALLQSGTGNPYAGAPIFAERCAPCHRLFHLGGRVGPDLTPYQRDDLGTLLPSILEPSTEIREGYVNQRVETRDGRVLSGIVADQDANIVVLRGLDGVELNIPRSDIASVAPTGTSLMPDGLLDGLTDAQVLDFFAYLRIPQPIGR